MSVFYILLLRSVNTIAFCHENDVAIVIESCLSRDTEVGILTQFNASILCLKNALSGPELDIPISLRSNQIESMGKYPRQANSSGYTVNLILEQIKADNRNATLKFRLSL